MAKRYPFEIQVINRPFSSFERIPEHLWRTVGRASHPVTALRRAEKERRGVTPQRNAWSGHVRILCGGKPVVIEDHGNIIMSCDDFSRVDWTAYA
jgi:hypothetical protein